MRRRVAVLGDQLDSLLFDKQPSVGKQVFVNGVPFIVIGRTKHKTQNSSYNSRDGDRIFIPASTHKASMWDFVEDAKQSRLITTGIQIFLGIVGVFTLMVAGIGVANIMYVTVRERTREIGVKMAVGARKQHIMLQFVFESLLLALGGGLVGLVFSSLLVIGVDSIPTANPAMDFLMNTNNEQPSNR